MRKNARIFNVWQHCMISILYIGAVNLALCKEQLLTNVDN